MMSKMLRSNVGFNYKNDKTKPLVVKSNLDCILITDVARKRFSFLRIKKQENENDDFNENTYCSIASQD